MPAGPYTSGSFNFEQREHKHRNILNAVAKSNCNSNICGKKAGCCPKTEQWKQVSDTVMRALKLTVEC